MRETFVVSELQRHALCHGELVQRALQNLYLFGRQQLQILPRGLVWHVFHDTRFRGRLRPYASRPQLIDRAAAGHRQHPCGDGPAGGVVAAGLRPDLHEDFLDNIFGVCPILQNSKREREDEASVAVVQLGKRALIAPSHARKRGLICQALLV